MKIPVTLVGDEVVTDISNKTGLLLTFPVEGTPKSWLQVSENKDALPHPPPSKFTHLPCSMGVCSSRGGSPLEMRELLTGSAEGKCGWWERAQAIALEAPLAQSSTGAQLSPWPPACCLRWAGPVPQKCAFWQLPPPPCPKAQCRREPYGPLWTHLP